MKILGVIPARYASTRFPGKPLVDIGGKSMVQRVYERACMAERLSGVVVATDDRRIYDHVLEVGGRAVMTSSSHPTGTDRIIEVAGLLPEFQGYINIQGDEPFIDPRQIDQVAEIMGSQKEACVATLAKRIHDTESLHNPNTVKAVFGNDGRALYFSRSPIPYMRDAKMEQDWQRERGYFKHIGIYGYANGALQEIGGMKRGMLEQAESLEQLRWLESGMPIYIGVTELESQAVDTPEDLQLLLPYLS